MSVLSDINKTINSTDMLLWYKYEYISFVIDHIDDIAEISQSPATDWHYIAYIPSDYHPNGVSCTRETCIEWLLNNNKIQLIASIDDTIDGKYCYTYEFLEDSSLMAHIFNAYWSKMMQAADNCSKNTMWTIDSMPETTVEHNPHTWTMKADYSKNMMPELTKTYYYYPIS